MKLWISPFGFGRCVDRKRKKLMKKRIWVNPCSNDEGVEWWDILFV